MILSVIYMSLLAAAHGASVTDCTAESSMYKFMKCFQAYIKQDGTISASNYAKIAPTESDLSDWRSISYKMLKARNPDECKDIQVPENLVEQVYLDHARFCRKGTCKDYCLLFEKKQGANGQLARGFGMFATVLGNGNGKSLHISAAHPFTDGNVHLQAAYVTDTTPGVKSLAVQGATRRAVTNGVSSCQKSSGPTDGAHNTKLAFHASLLATREWQFSSTGGGGCAKSDCGFIQFHGMASTSCGTDAAFITPGFSDLTYYKEDIPEERLTAVLKELQPDWKVETKKSGSSCRLLATTNTFGRVLNGVPEGRECATRATINGTQFSFIHIESKRLLRSYASYPVWSEALKKTFNLV